MIKETKETIRKLFKVCDKSYQIGRSLTYEELHQRQGGRLEAFEEVEEFIKEIIKGEKKCNNQDKYEEQHFEHQLKIESFNQILEFLK